MTEGMETALIISSSVAASRVGATASAFCLRRLGVETVVLPTTLFGRHPGWGAPGGMKTPPDLLRDMWSGIAAQDMRFDGIMTGYMGHVDHVHLASEIIRAAKANNPALHVLVDPVMGDAGRLYISEDIAHAIKTELIPLADIITPNLWELEYLTGERFATLGSIATTASHLPCASIVTSVPDSGKDGDKIGAMLTQGRDSHIASHEKFASVPNGGGDSLAGAFLAHRLKGRSAEDALARATASVFSIISSAQDDDLGELPLVRAQDALINAQPLPLRIIPHDEHRHD